MTISFDDDKWSRGSGRSENPGVGGSILSLKYKKTVVFVTHDVAEAVFLAE